MDKDEKLTIEENEATPAEEKSLGLDEGYADEVEAIKARIAERKKLQAEKKAKAKKKGRIILGVVVAVIGAFIFSISPFFTTDSIEVRGNEYFSAEEIINMAHASPGKNLIYHPDKGTIVKYLKGNPYIEKAKVSRKFPSTLVITVNERTQVGALLFDDEFLIIDNNGYLLRKTKTRPELTEVKGIVVKKIKLGEKIEVEDPELLEQTLDILNAMNRKDLYFVSLDMSQMYIKAYVYESFVCKGTYSELHQGIEKDRLHRVLDHLIAEGIKRGTITFGEDGYASFVPTL